MAALRVSSFPLHARQLQCRLIRPSALRHASAASTPPPKPRLLEKPAKFNPPSHPARIRTKPKVYGAPISEHERVAQKTRQYPHMMPPEGSFLHWFLTNRSIHLYISLSILVFLTFGIWFEDFVHTTPYKDLLPPNSMFFAHPFKFLRRYFEVYDMHAGHVSAETAERRRQKVEDVKKRSEYRKAHGLDVKDEGLFGGWTAKEDDEVMGAGMREGPAIVTMPQASNATVEAAPAVEEAVTGEASSETYVDFEGKTHEMKKKWFGIW